MNNSPMKIKPNFSPMDIRHRGNTPSHGDAGVQIEPPALTKEQAGGEGVAIENENSEYLLQPPEYDSQPTKEVALSESETEVEKTASKAKAKMSKPKATAKKKKRKKAVKKKS